MNVVRRVLIGSSLAILLVGISNADAEPVHPILPVPYTEFKEILPISIVSNHILEPIIESRHGTLHDPSTKPKVHLPPNPAHVVSVKPKQHAPKLTGNFTSGVASYYCLRGKSRCTIGHSGGPYAAIRKDLLFLRGKTVKVCRVGGSCTFVTIIDCNCGPNANLIDLYSYAFKKLGPISLGVLKVKVTW